VRTGFPENSIFYGRDINARVHVDWGTFSLVAALKELITSALEDRLNQKFMLISESGIPLYPGETMWVELMVEEKSRINACELGVSYLSSPAHLDPGCTGSLLWERPSAFSVEACLFPYFSERLLTPQSSASNVTDTVLPS